MGWFSQIAEWKGKHDDVKQDFGKELESLNATIYMQGQEEAFLQGQLLSLQDRIGVEEQPAREADNNL
eukprot:6062926-Prorocentrum_lima.AAC.1